MIPISKVELGAAEEELVLQVLRSGQLAQGFMVERFERSFAPFAGTEHAVAASSGTTALVLAFRVLDLQPGDEIVTSPFTFAATVNAALEAGATVRFVDIRSDDFGLDASLLDAAVNERTRAIVPVHLYGQAANMPAIMAIAESNGIAVVEDACQAHGASIDGSSVGGIGLMGCFSFYATKNVTTGEGGMVTTNDGCLADRLRLLRAQGMRRRYEFEEPGYNYRLTELQAAIGIPQLERLHERTERRRRNATRLTNGLAGIPGLVTPVALLGRDHVYHQYTVRVTAESRMNRDELVSALEDHGIGCGVYYPRSLAHYDCYRQHPRVLTDERMPIAESMAREVMSLPVHPWLTSDDVDEVLAVIQKLLG